MKSVKPLLHDDQETIKSICDEKPGWLTHKNTWQQALIAYEAAGGNPWIVKPTIFSPDIRIELKELYKTRRSSGHIKRIRDYHFSGSCPLCGSLATGSVDHYLPRSIFPEFSIYSLNLIPACSSCNSEEKGATYIGVKSPARIIHPYFDKLADKPILSVSFTPPYNAVKLSAASAPGLAGNELDIVGFHLHEVLGDAFRKYITNLWSTLPRTVAELSEIPASSITLADTQRQVQWLFKSSIYTNGLNSWPTGFYRGLLADSGAIEYIAQKATEAILV
jgi:hypothetical protein